MTLKEFLLMLDTEKKLKPYLEWFTPTEEVKNLFNGNYSSNSVKIYIFEKKEQNVAIYYDSNRPPIIFNEKQDIDYYNKILENKDLTIHKTTYKFGFEFSDTLIPYSYDYNKKHNTQSSLGNEFANLETFFSKHYWNFIVCDCYEKHDILSAISPYNDCLKDMLTCKKSTPEYLYLKSIPWFNGCCFDDSDITGQDLIDEVKNRFKVGSFNGYSFLKKYSHSYLTIIELDGIDGTKYKIVPVGSNEKFSVSNTSYIGATIAAEFSDLIQKENSTILDDVDVNNITIKGDTDMVKVYDDTPWSVGNDKNLNNNFGLNLDFGPCSNPNIRMSLYGIAVKNNSGNYVSYDKNTGNVVDVDIINFKGDKCFWKIPVAIKDIKVGDTIVHNRVPMFVVSTDNSEIKAIDIAAAEKKEIIPVTNVFGFNFVTKIVSLFDAFGGDVNASADNPFGNMLPFLLMNDNSNMDNMLPILMMTNSEIVKNPLMLMALMGNNNDNMMMALMLSGAMGNNTPFTALTQNSTNDNK